MYLILQVFEHLKCVKNTRRPSLFLNSEIFEWNPQNIGFKFFNEEFSEVAIKSYVKVNISLLKLCNYLTNIWQQQIILGGIEG